MMSLTCCNGRLMSFHAVMRADARLQVSYLVIFWQSSHGPRAGSLAGSVHCQMQLSSAYIRLPCNFTAFAVSVRCRHCLLRFSDLNLPPKNWEFPCSLQNYNDIKVSGVSWWILC